MVNTDAALRERFLLQEEFLGTDKEVNRTEPLVSVTVATYQQAAYIRECLDGILMQRTDFPFEVIVGEDGSTDGTREICEEYARRHPDRIRLFNRDRSLSQYVDEDGHTVRFNGLWNRMSVRGKYIAFCEGDDYWTDPLKLQKQVDWLESHPECGLVYTGDCMYNQRHGFFYPNSKSSPYLGFRRMLYRNPISTLTVCLRKSLYDRYEEEIPQRHNWLMGDYPMWLYFAANSDIHYMPERTAVYRLLEESASHSRDVMKMNRFWRSICDVSTFFAAKYGEESIIPDVRRRCLRKVLKNNLRACNPMTAAECRAICPGGLANPKILVLFIALSLKTACAGLFAK